MLREEVADTIRNSILTGELPRGSRLDLVSIADEQDVSQLPVREALIALEAEGLVKSETRRGYYVAVLDEQDFADHYEVFGKVAGIAAARAAKTMPDDEIDQLQAVNKELRESTSPDEQEEANQEFHRLLNRAGGSNRLRSVMKSLARGMDVHFGEVIPDWHLHAADEHQAIIEAVRRRDPEAARAAMERHLTINGERAVDAMTTAGFFSTDGGATA